MNTVLNNKLTIWNIVGWLFGIAVLSIGVLNMIYVHPVPGAVYLLVSFVYFPPSNAMFKKRFSLSIPLVIKIILGIVIIWFTLGISDLGDMID